MGINDKCDMVNSPPHYSEHGYECIDILEDLGYAYHFCLGNAIKYLWRCERKNGLEDLKKARWYIDRAIKMKENK